MLSYKVCTKYIKEYKQANTAIQHIYLISVLGDNMIHEMKLW